MSLQSKGVTVYLTVFCDGSYHAIFSTLEAAKAAAIDPDYLLEDGTSILDIKEIQIK